MEPPHALIGPGTTLGFMFRTAVLDLSDASNPGPAKPPPPNARSLPADWQGIWIPEARFFVAPHGLDDLAVAAGVEDLWIGIGGHYGVTGTFELDVVNRGEAPTIRARYHDAAGRWIGTEGTAPDLTVELPERTTLVVDASGGIAPMTTSITAGGVTTNGTRAEVTPPAAGNVVISVTVTDAGAQTSTVNITASRKVGAAGVILGEGDTTKPAELVGPTSGTNAILCAAATIPPPAHPGRHHGRGQLELARPDRNRRRRRVPVAAGQTIPVSASRTVAATTARTLSAFFHHDHPTVAEDGDTAPRSFAYSTSQRRTPTPSRPSRRAAPAGRRRGPSTTPPAGTSSSPSAPPMRSRSGASPPTTATTPRPTTTKRVAPPGGGPPGEAPGGADRGRPTGAEHRPRAGRRLRHLQGQPHRSPPGFWKAVASYNQPSTSTDTSTTTLRRPPAEEPAPPVTPTDAKPAQRRSPTGSTASACGCGSNAATWCWPRSTARSTCARRRNGRWPPTIPRPSCHRRSAPATASPSSSSGSTSTTRPASGRSPPRSRRSMRTERLVGHRPTDGGRGIRAVNTLGAYAALGPLLAAVAPASPASGEVVPLAITAGAATGLAVANVIKPRR